MMIIKSGIKRWLLRVLTAVVALPALYFAAGLLGAVIQGPGPLSVRAAEQYVGLVRGPIHYDFLLPATPEIRARFGFAEAAGVPVSEASIEWIIAGWGAKDFYTSTKTLGELDGLAAAKAISGDASVLHLSVAGNLLGVEDVDFVPMSNAQMQGLLDFIEASFQRDAAGQPIVLAEKFGKNDAFFAAQGQFNILNTCNVWVGRALREAGLPFGIWTPTVQSVELSLRWFVEAS